MTKKKKNVFTIALQTKKQYYEIGRLILYYKLFMLKLFFNYTYRYYRFCIDLYFYIGGYYVTYIYKNTIYNAIYFILQQFLLIIYFHFSLNFTVRSSGEACKGFLG